MNIMFHSCNGFSLSVNSNEFTGPDPLWRDVLNKHLSRPFHVMLGGGDQQYSDAVMRDTVHFKEWLQTKNPEHKHRAEFSEEMQDELETFYLDRYSMWFSQGLFGMANRPCQIPMINIWDDHDIIDVSFVTTVAYLS
jgi:phosphodiesterase/alkaline phosphatase D-like protein